MNKHCIAILRRLLNKEVIGGKHTEEKNVFRWTKNLSPEEQKQLKKDWEKEVIQARIVSRYKKTGQIHISINPDQVKYVRELVTQSGGKVD